ncbi:MAG: hypothetical protein HN509_16240 [Halobacteriovoraceae bacterium]|jgi:hypothetical protein|nr:hypothetical protein [Halobacteriovoraceae bacterium]MBT5095031.1 hypothetical protein [Halobacteriovoraceae bacterium]
MKILISFLLIILISSANGAPNHPDDSYRLTYFDVLLQRLQMVEFDLHGRYFEVGFFNKGKHRITVVIEETPYLKDLTTKGKLKNNRALKQSVRGELTQFLAEIDLASKAEVAKLNLKGVVFKIENRAALPQE